MEGEGIKENRDMIEVCGCSVDAEKAKNAACCCCNETIKCVHHHREGMHETCLCVLDTAVVLVTCPISFPIIACSEFCADSDYDDDETNDDIFL